MKDRIIFTEEEKLAQATLGNSNYQSFNMNEKGLDEIIKRERTSKFNNQVDAYNEILEKNNKETTEAQNALQYDINKAEIKPMFNRVIVKPFKQNPFQKMEVKGSLIVDAGGYTPHQEFNPVTGKYEEQPEFIITGCVVEVGPETKYLKEGDVIYYRKDTVVPVPFFKQGLVCLAESQIIAVVNEGLSERFNSIK